MTQARTNVESPADGSSPRRGSDTPTTRKGALQMPNYLLSVHTAEDEPRQPMTEEELRRGMEPVRELEAAMEAAGAFVFSGRLDSPTGARVVRPFGKRVKTTDGPYIETKEHLGGFYIIDAADRETALEWAERVSLAIDRPIEVWPFVATSAA